MWTSNTHLARAGEFKTYGDLLNPKWKGKMVAQDPRTTGSGESLTYFLLLALFIGFSNLKTGFNP